jgi:hypothetical protein
MQNIRDIKMRISLRIMILFLNPLPSVGASHLLAGSSLCLSQIFQAWCNEEIAASDTAESVEADQKP